MEENFKRLAGLTARALNVSEQTVADWVESEESSKELTKAFKENREKIDSDTAARTSGRLKRQVEQLLKEKGVEAPDFDKLSDGLDTLAAAAVAAGGSQVTDEQALQHPAVKRALTEAANEKTRAVEDAQRQASDQLKTDRAAFAKEQLDSKVESAARKAIVELNPNLNPDSAKAERQVSRLVADIKAGSFKVEDDGTLTPVDAEGKYLDNGGGGRKSFAEMVRDTVTAEYDLPASTDKQGTGVQQRDVAGGDARPIKTKEDYDAAYIKAQADPAALDKLEATYPDFAKSK